MSLVSVGLSLPSTVHAQEKKLDNLNVAMPPVSAYLPIIVGDKKGFYEEEGISLTFNPDIQGPQLVPAVLSGSVQVSGLIWPLLAITASQGLPLHAVSALSSGGSTADDDDQQLVVLEKSDVKSGADLAGKTVATNTIRNMSEALVRGIVEKDGGDQSTVKFTPVLFPNMLGALRAGTVDAAAMIEPFLTLAKQQEDIRVLAGVNSSLKPLAPTGMMIMTAEFIQQNPDVVARFQRATKKAVDYVADGANEAEVRQLLVEHLRLPAEVAEQMTLPKFVSYHDVADVQLEVDALVKYGIIEKNVDLAPFDAQMKP
jgi:NitT/TauT family transport system substrate-binding protein